MKNRHRSHAFLAALAAILPLLAVSHAPLSGLHMADEAPATETDEEKKKREEEEEKAKKSKAEDDEKKKKEEEDAASAKAKAAAPSPLAARIAGALASLKGGTPAQLAATIAAKDGEIATLRADLATAQATATQAAADRDTAKASLTSTEATLATLCGYLGIKPADVAGKSAADVTAALNAKVDALAVEQIAGLGFNSAKLPAPSGSTGGEQKTKAELFAEYNALTNANDRAAFYAKHKVAMGL